MENIEKILLAVIAFAITSVIAYLFKMRQLYVALPKLYSHAPLTTNGALAELIIYNRGNQVEEDIQIEFDQALRLELIASSSAEITLQKSIIKLDRLHERTEQSIVLLIENGALSKDKIKSISSKGVKGRIFSATPEVPPNYARLFVTVLFFLSIFPAFIYGIENINRFKGMWAEHKLSIVKKNGWTGLNDYYWSNINESYQGTEFPMRLLKTSQTEKSVTATYEVANKTAIPLEVSSLKLSGARENEKFDSPYFATVEVSPLTAGKLEVEIPISESNNNNYTLEFLVKHGAEHISGIQHTFRITPTSNGLKK